MAAEDKRRRTKSGRERTRDRSAMTKDKALKKRDIFKTTKDMNKLKRDNMRTKMARMKTKKARMRDKEMEGQAQKGKECEILQTQHLDGENQDAKGLEQARKVHKQDKNEQKKDKELHERGIEGQEQYKESHEQDKEGQLQNNEGQKQDREGQLQDKEGKEQDKEGQEQDKEEQEQDKGGQMQDKEGQEQDKEGQEQDKEEQERQNAQNKQETPTSKEEVDNNGELGTERSVDLVGKDLEELETVEVDRVDRIRDGEEEGGGGGQVVEQEEALADKVKSEGQSARVKCEGQAGDQCGNSISSETIKEDSIKTTPVERDRKWTNRLKAMEAHISGSGQLNSSLTEVDPGGAEAEAASSSTPSSSALEDPTTCSITPGRETTIEIDKGRLALGVDVIGGINTLLGVILIHEIYENGAAAKDGRLAIGDQIIEVNGELFHDITDELANEILRQTPPVVRLVVYREETPLREEEIYDLFNLDLLKKPGKGLGISIIGRHRDNGIFVSDVIKGGVADLDGQLMPGDQILVINGTDVRHVSQQYAAEMLKTLIGRVSLTVGRVKCLSRSTSRSSSSLSEVDSDEEAAALASVQKRDHGKDKVKEKVTR